MPRTRWAISKMPARTPLIITTVPFVIAASTHLVALAMIHLLLPRLEPMTLDRA